MIHLRFSSSAGAWSLFVELYPSSLGGNSFGRNFMSWGSANRTAPVNTVRNGLATSWERAGALVAWGG